MKRPLFILLSLAWMTDMTGLAAIGPVGRHAWIAGLLYGLGFLLLLLLIRSFPQDLDFRKAFVVIFMLGVIGRIPFLFYPHSNDLNRYIWEGYIQTLGFNPYRYAPDSPALSDVAAGNLRTIWEGINHKEFTAIYPPLTLLLFRLLATIKPEPLLFKVVILICDLGVISILALMINRRRQHPKRLLIYAVNPLGLLFITGEGHLDVIQVFLLCLGCYFLITERTTAGFLLLGLAGMSKYFALISVPFFIHARNFKKAPLVLLPLLLYLPFVEGGAQIFQSLGEFGAEMHYNDSVFALLRLFFPDAAVFPALLLLGFCLVWIFLIVHDPLKSLYLACAALLVFLPTMHPWYLILIVPFLVFFASKAWLYLLAAMVFTFPVLAVEYTNGFFKEILWLKPLVYVPFYALLARGLFRDGHFLQDHAYARPGRISIIIPTLNEAEQLDRSLNALRNRNALQEVIIADGGSDDRTLDLAETFGAKVIHSQNKGRGHQIQDGLEVAGGDVLLVLHADCVLKKGALTRLLHELDSNPSAVGGAFGMQFDQTTAKTRLIAALNNWRARFTGISFGDQGQFWRAEILSAAGGFPAMMLMEDVEMSFRLKESGRVIYLKDGVVVSGRRWQSGDFSRKFLLVLRLLLKYLIERRLGLGSRSAAGYYRRYYNGQDHIAET
jgi:rSAM/selenodomain-associated transferase 2